MSPLKKLFSVFIKTYFSFEWRISNGYYLVWLVGIWAIMFIWLVLVYVLALWATGTTENIGIRDILFVLVVWTVFLFSIIGNLAISTKRFHDIGYSGISCLWFAILWFLLNIFLLILPGTQKDNKYWAPISSNIIVKFFFEQDWFKIIKRKIGFKK